MQNKYQTMASKETNHINFKILTMNEREIDHSEETNDFNFKIMTMR